MGKLISFKEKKESVESQNLIDDIFQAASKELSGVIIIGWRKDGGNFYSDTNLTNCECMYLLEYAKKVIFDGD